jgi:hypothetical protein
VEADVSGASLFSLLWTVMGYTPRNSRFPTRLLVILDNTSASRVNPGADVLCRWDEWVPEGRLLKLNEAGFALRRKLLEAQTKKNRPSAPAVSTTATAAGASTSPAPGAKGKEKGGAKKETGSARKRARETANDTVSGGEESDLTPPPPENKGGAKGKRASKGKSAVGR